MYHRLAHRQLCFFNWCFLFQNDSSWCQGNIKLSRTPMPHRFNLFTTHGRWEFHTNVVLTFPFKEICNFPLISKYSTYCKQANCLVPCSGLNGGLVPWSGLVVPLSSSIWIIQSPDEKTVWDGLGGVSLLNHYRWALRFQKIWDIPNMPYSLSHGCWSSHKLPAVPAAKPFTIMGSNPLKLHPNKIFSFIVNLGLMVFYRRNRRITKTWSFTTKTLLKFYFF